MEEVKLTKTGDWIWRDGEISYKSFQELATDLKQKHLNFLISIGKENFGSNDWYIMKHYGPKNFFDEKSRPFITLDTTNDTPTKIKFDFSIFENDVATYSKKDCEDILNTYFKKVYDDWKWGLAGSTPERFIDAIKSDKLYQPYIGKVIMKYYEYR